MNRFDDALVVHYDHARFALEVHSMLTVTSTVIAPPTFQLPLPSHIQPSCHTLTTPSTSTTSKVALPLHTSS